MLRYPHIDPIAVSLGPVRIHWYGIMYLVGFAAAWWLARRRAAQPASSWKSVDVDDFVFYAMLGVILGGRIGYVFFYGLPLWRADALYPLKIWEGGMSFHGGLLGVITAAAIFAPVNLPAAHPVSTLIPSLSTTTRCEGTPEFSISPETRK